MYKKKKTLMLIEQASVYQRQIESYQNDLRYFYNMTEEEANRYWKELKYNESLIVRKDV